MHIKQLKAGHQDTLFSTDTAGIGATVTRTATPTNDHNHSRAFLIGTVQGLTVRVITLKLSKQVYRQNNCSFRRAHMIASPADNVHALHDQDAEIQRMSSIIQAQKTAFASQPYPSAEQRIEHLGRLKTQLLKYQDEICAALDSDFGGRSADETLLAEVMTSLEGVHYNSKNLRRWMKPQKRKVGAAQWPGSAMVTYQPVGVVGVISPWNYPFYLAFGPLAGALAAGNRVMIKMSESTPASGALIRKMIAEVFEENHVAVFNGEVEAGVAFSKLPFDHLLFTGATSIGRHVMRAAAENLTPVTLELGGKSPCIISDDFPMHTAAERIAWGKTLNAGQTCIAPDYVLVPENRRDEFVEQYRAAVQRFFPTLRDNPDYTAIINARQLQRLEGYLRDAEAQGAR